MDQQGAYRTQLEPLGIPINSIRAFSKGFLIGADNATLGIYEDISEGDGEEEIEFSCKKLCQVRLINNKIE